MKIALAAIALAFACALQALAQERLPINPRDYYPLADGDTWTYQTKYFRADGQAEYRLRTLTVAGEAKIDAQAAAKKLIDERGRYWLINADERALRLLGENTGGGEVRINPAYVLLDTAYAPGKLYPARYTPTEGDAVGGEATFLGFESVQTPAGAFRDCLKLRFVATRPSGATTTTTRYLARGVGLVKEIIEVFSPAAEQSLRYESELAHATLGGRALNGARTIKIAEYFPFHQGDSWTYDWAYRFANGQTRTTERKRWFEGTKFTNAGAAFKLVANTGEDDYQFYVLDRGGLRIVESGEKGTRAQGVKFYYDPALLIARDDSVLGRAYRWSQPDAESKTLIQYATTLDGFEPVETPMGRYENCLRARVEWETASARVKNIYFYARGVGLVAYDYEVIGKKDDAVMMLTGRVKEATINGSTVKTADEAKKLWDKMASELASAEDNPQARALFKEASLNRYVWDADLGFRGFTADVVMKVDGGAPVPFQVKCSPTLEIEIDAPDAATKAIIHEEMSQFVTHRQPRKPFDAWYGPDKAKFKLGKETPEGREIFIEGDSMGSNYIIGDKQVRQLSRNIGRLEFTIFNQKHLPVEDGRYIATEYGVSYYPAGTKQEIGRELFTDTYVKQGAYWVPKSRVHTSTMRGKPARIELEITRLDYLK